MSGCEVKTGAATTCRNDMPSALGASFWDGGGGTTASFAHKLDLVGSGPFQRRSTQKNTSGALLYDETTLLLDGYSHESPSSFLDSHLLSLSLCVPYNENNTFAQ